MIFKIGDRVVCIDDKMQPHTTEELKKDIPNWVKENEEYTIRAVLDNKGIVKGVLLEEIKNQPKYFDILGGFQEPAFAEWRFRKLKLNENLVEVNQEVNVMV
jgi:hypothetical protein